MAYKNLHLTPRDQEFRDKYKSVIDAVAKLEMLGEMEAEFTNQAGMHTWRRKCYEYQQITGKTFRIEQGPGYILILRRKRRLPRGDHGLKELREHRLTDLPEHGVPEGGWPDEEVVVSEADMELARQVLAKVKKEEKDTDYYQKLLGKGGSKDVDDTGRSESGGDESSSGPASGDSDSEGGEGS